MAHFKSRKRKDGRPFNPASKKQLEMKIRRTKVLEYRLQGLTYEEIGTKLGIGTVRAYQLMMDTLNTMDAELAEKIPQARRIELERLRKMFNCIWAQIKKGNTKAVAAGIKISERISKLRGLDEPVKITGTGEGGAITVEVFRKMIAETPDDSTAANVVLDKVQQRVNGGVHGSDITPEL